MALDFSLFTGTFANAWLGLLDSLSTDRRHVLFCELRSALDTRLHASALTSELISNPISVFGLWLVLRKVLGFIRRS